MYRPIYSIISYCQFKTLLRHMAHVCECVPDYVPGVREIVKNTSIKGKLPIYYTRNCYCKTKLF